MDGAPGRIRTCDQLISSQPLYPTELPGHTSLFRLYRSMLSGTYLLGFG